MLKSFYNFLEKEITSYFQSNKISGGQRFHFVIEDKEVRTELIKILNKSVFAQSCHFTNLFNSPSNIRINEGTYETSLLSFPEQEVKIVICDSTTATDGYLTLLRNSFGKEGTRYSDYASLFILSGSRTESLTTASKDLQAPGMPFSFDALSNKLKAIINEEVISVPERSYVVSYLKKIVEADSRDFFELEEILDLVQSDKNLKGQFYKINCFPDDEIYKSNFKLKSSDLDKRIKENEKYYTKVASILNNEPGVEERKSRLDNFLDDSLASHLAKSDTRNNDWAATSLNDILKSIEKKGIESNLKFNGFFLNSEEKGVSYNEGLNDKLGKNRKTNAPILIYNSNGLETNELTFKFNKSLDNNIVVSSKKNSKKETKNDSARYDKEKPKVKLSSPVDAKVSGRNLIIKMDIPFVHVTVSQNNDKHQFYILRISAPNNVFKEIEPYLKITSKGLINIKLQSDISSITLGDGVSEKNDVVGPIHWDKDSKLTIDIASLDEDRTYEINFGDSEVNLKFKAGDMVAIAARPIQIFKSIWNNKATYQNRPIVGCEKDIFRRIRYKDKETTIESHFKVQLQIEQQFVVQRAILLKKTFDDSGLTIYEKVKVNIPESVEKALFDIYQYFNSNQTIPSLSYVTDELKSLYNTYLLAIKAELNFNANGQGLPSYLRNLTKLGVLEYDGNVAFSPFHPILVGFILEFKKHFNGIVEGNELFKLLTPFSLLPYIYYDGNNMHPVSEEWNEDMKTWLFYKKLDAGQESRTNSVTRNMVKSKMNEFVKNFNFLFKNKDCPIIISLVNVSDDQDAIAGLFEFLLKNVDRQGTMFCVELHLYSKNIQKETYYESLNRLQSFSLIEKKLIDDTDLKIQCNYKDITSSELIRQLFTRVEFYKHELLNDTSFEFSHLAFYQMNTGTSCVYPNSSNMRCELSMGGLISNSSILRKEDNYTMGFGTKGMKNPTILTSIAVSMNEVYSNSKGHGISQFTPNTCVAKNYRYNDQRNLQNLYRDVNWVVFIKPEFDLDFFYNQKGTYIVHYTDQYSINTKYDSVTVTKKAGLYINLLNETLKSHGLLLPSETEKEKSQDTINYFNCLNGSWLIGMIKKSNVQAREKVSLVAAAQSMRKLLGRSNEIVWIPISLAEVLRVSGSVGLPQEGPFSIKTLKETGGMSDDLLMLGTDISDDGIVKMYYYPVEVKVSINSDLTSKASEQIVHTSKLFEEHLLGELTFTKEIFRTFFVSIYLSNLDKFYANNLISSEQFEKVQDFRYQLMNSMYEVVDNHPDVRLGNAAIVSFQSDDSWELFTRRILETSVCNLRLNHSKAYASLIKDDEDLDNFLLHEQIVIQGTTPFRAHKSHQENKIHPKQELNSLSMDNEQNEDEMGIDHTVDKSTEKLILPDLDSSDKTKSLETAADLSIPMDRKLDTVPSIKEENEGSVSKFEQKGIRILMGHVNNHPNRPIYFEPNNSEKVSHPNLGILGTMGLGKTQLACSLVAQLSHQANKNIGGSPVGLLIFDYKGDYVGDKFVNDVNGSVHSSRLPFNPLKIIYTEKQKSLNMPAITADTISDALSKSYGWGRVQKSLIKQIIVSVYEDFGITSNPETWDNPAPSFDKVIDTVLAKDDGKANKVYSLFDTLKDYSLFTTDNSECVSMFEWLNKTRIIDLSIFPDDTKRVIVGLLLELFNSEMRKPGESLREGIYRQLRVMILVDEAGQFLQKDFSALRKIISEGRMFGVGTILSTQTLSDFHTSVEDYSQFILSWAIHNVPTIKENELKGLLGVGYDAKSGIEFIGENVKFRSICKIGGSVKYMMDKPYFEYYNERHPNDEL